MNLGFIGAGKVSVNLARLFNAIGHNICGFFSKSPSSSQYAASVISTTNYTSLNELINSSDVIFIGTNDDVISKICNYIYNEETTLEHKIFVHFSGIYSSDILAPLLNKAATVISMHPVYSFTNKEIPMDELKKISYTIEGSGDLYKYFIENIAVPTFEINKLQKPLYHAAAATICNLAVALYATGFEMLRDCGIKNPEVLFKSLISQPAENMLKMPASKALTGPIARGDVKTVSIHLDAVSKNELWKKIYCTLSEKAAEIAEIDDNAKETIKEMVTNGKNYNCKASENEAK